MLKKFAGLIFILVVLGLIFGCEKRACKVDLWETYNTVLKSAKYVDLTHAFNPTIPVWPGFGNAKFQGTTAGNELPGYAKLGEVFDYKKHGFIATAYWLPTDQYGTQLDPPAHWDDLGATIS